MPVAIIDNGQANRIDVDPEVIARGSGTLLLTGNDNAIEIAAGCALINANISVGENCRVTVGSACRLAQIDLFASRSGRVVIGDNTNFTSVTRIYLHEPGMVSIGSGCLIASDTFFTISDMHTLIDLASGKRLNPAVDIVIGDKVWIGAEAAVMKGVKIGEGSAVGYRAVVTRNLPAFCLAVGTPARVVKRGISWLPTV